MRRISVQQSRQFVSRWPTYNLAVVALLCAVIGGGCRSNSQNQSAFRWPWQAAAPRTPAAPQVASSPQGQSNPANGPWSVANNATDPTERLQSLFRRESEQVRLADEQRRALADLAQWQRQQEEQLALMARDRQQEKIAELQEQAAIVASQRAELEQVSELRRRALELDTNNSELHAQLAQAEQQNRVLEDRMALLQRQLNDAANQLQASLQTQQQTEQRILQAQSDSQRALAENHDESEKRIAEIRRDAEQRVAAMQASMQRRGSATITANSSLARSLTPVSIAGLLVRPDGDVIRIEIPTDRIFAPGTAALQESAIPLIDQVAGSIRESYPEQRIGIEAHTDSGPIQNTAWRNPHQLTAAQAMAVFEQFVRRHQFPEQQLFVGGHGANHPIASNAEAAGQQRNRRIEVVIYPETVSQR